MCLVFGLGFSTVRVRVVKKYNIFCSKSYLICIYICVGGGGGLGGMQRGIYALCSRYLYGYMDI